MKDYYKENSFQNCSDNNYTYDIYSPTGYQMHPSGVGGVQSVNLYPFPGNYQGVMPDNFTISQNTAEYLYKQSIISEQNAQIELLKMNIQHQNKMEETVLKSNLAEKREEASARRKVERENATTQVFENPDGKICIQIQFPDGRANYSNPILKYASLKLIRTDSHEEDGIDIVSWIDADKTEHQIILRGNERSSKHLMKGLEKAGNPLLVARDRKKQICDLVYGYLVDHCRKVYMPKHYGWNKTKSGWIFVNHKEMTLEKLKRKVM